MVAPVRRLRPFDTASSAWGQLPERDPSCPFCPGNESELPRILWQYPESDAGAWQVRAAANRYPALTPREPGQALLSSPPTPDSVSRPAVGAQEVLIESPRHDRDPSFMTRTEMEAVVEGYQHRYAFMAGADPEAHVILFKNRGAEAGNSLIHPHAQLYALRDPVPEILQRHAWALRHLEEEGACALCRLDSLEPDFERRVLAANPSFRAVVPWAPVTSFEIWIVPTRHQASFAESDDREKADLAGILATVLRQLRMGAGDPAYNALWHGGRPRDSGAPHLHWHIQIRPKVARQAGFELISGVDVCPSDPIEDAELLRTVSLRDVDVERGGTRPR